MRFNYRGRNGELFTEVYVNPLTKKVKVINHTDDFIDKAFGNNDDVTYADVLDFFESRTFPRNRENIDEILGQMGLSCYDPYRMCLVTKGKMAEDGCWIEFL